MTLFLHHRIKLCKMNKLKKELINATQKHHNKHRQKTPLESFFPIIKAYLTSLQRKINSQIEIKRRSNKRKSFTAILQNNRTKLLQILKDNSHRIQRINLKYNNIIINSLHNQVDRLYNKRKIMMRMIATVP
jgi:hypothetical protein